MITTPVPDIATIATTRYNIVPFPARTPPMLQTLSETVRRVLNTRHAALSVYLPNGRTRQNVFFNLCAYLSGGGDAAADTRATTLIAINTAFNQRNAALNFASYQATQAAEAVAALGAGDLADFRNFVAARACLVPLFLDLMAHCGPNRASALQAMYWTARCFRGASALQQQGRCAGFTPRTIAAISQAARLYPIHAGFPGFTMWGTGDNLPEDEDEARLVPRDDEITRHKNLRWHFMKHVLSIGKEGAEVYSDESAGWWRRLGITLRRTDLTKVTPIGDTQIAHMFTTGGALMDGYISAFLALPLLAENASLVGRLVQQYEMTYGALALTESRRLRQVAVMVSNNKVLVSGYVGDLYLIGRVEPNGIVGISSCYMADDIREKLEGRKAVMLWEVTNDF